jgi:hypothetical protein
MTRLQQGIATREMGLRPSVAQQQFQIANVRVNISISYAPVLLRAHCACVGSFSHGRARERKRHEFPSHGGGRAQMTSPIRPLLGK